ncbi:ABC transporter permease [Lepagella muris]|jgi:putative ABC transport system permease protein|uniref:FtsX-like permease family protein n=1 Tax=Lepagella muris TaxID=3032870 RepID=A0AC61RFB7_9BACT|nr:ABC transporter permease [Lepagella muris]ROT07099.1 FtsX-like permease family protein [Muribaculaceae bacterium Isolate-037 (Harlan)]TGY77938.1 FtsX-like permease family protein [Lepagella muris]THG51394.1 FtsX-like permease family protein [Bacteroidales bacterium]TKC56365.1 FtsX-like permease family protein [Bacteroidales bacterium]
MNYFKQIYYEMKHQRMMTWVSIGGTALAIFLVMAFIMADRINTVEVAPESNRARILQATGLHIIEEKNEGSTWGLNYKLLDRLYGNLDGIEMVCYQYAFDEPSDVNVKNGEILSMPSKKVDANYWNIYDFSFIDGRPFDEAEAASSKVVVLSRSLARALFGEEKVAGREIEVNAYSYRVIGVVEDVNPLLRSTNSKLYIPYNPAGKNERDEYFGSSMMTLLMKPGVSAESVKAQVEKRYEMLQSDLSKDNKRVVYHGQPYTTEEVGEGGYGSNNGPDIEQSRLLDYIVYGIIILLPAINLSSMTRSRLRHRVSEIGVRRAFGAKRSAIIRQILGENLIITMVGGLIGMVVSIIFMYLMFDVFFNSGSIFGASSLEEAQARPDMGMLMTWQNFTVAFIICFILNLLSAFVPAWKASKVEPAVAISRAH